MGINWSKNNTNNDDQSEVLTSSTAAENSNEVNLRQDNGVYHQYLSYGDGVTIKAVDQNGSIAWDPITGLCELCVARRLGPPEYEFNVVVVTNTTNTAFHQHTVKCLVRYYSVTFWAEGVAGKKQAAKRIAATAVYGYISGCQLEDVLARIVAGRHPSCLINVNEHDRTADKRWSSETIITAGDTVRTRSEIAVKRIPNEVNLLSDNNVDCNGQTNDGGVIIDSKDTAGPTRSSTDIEILSEEEKWLISWDPIAKIQELCSSRKWKTPEFKCSMIAIPTANSMSHRNTAKCLVRVDYMTFWAEGVAKTKKTAMRLAALKVYSKLTGYQRQDVISALHRRS